MCQNDDHKETELELDNKLLSLFIHWSEYGERYLTDNEIKSRTKDSLINDFCDEVKNRLNIIFIGDEKDD